MHLKHLIQHIVIKYLYYSLSNIPEPKTLEV